VRRTGCIQYSGITSAIGAFNAHGHWYVSIVFDNATIKSIFDAFVHDRSKTGGTRRCRGFRGLLSDSQRRSFARP
jgi:hypothetical protein